jgi:hypothetical protein
MKKTHEEMMTAVIAEIAKLCRGGKQPKFYWGNVWMRDGAAMYSLVIPSQVSVSGYLHNQPDATIRILYSLLGLETRDAVEALTDELEETNANYRHDVKGLNDKLQASEARSAKLVELCGKAFHKAYKQAQRDASVSKSYNPNDLYREWVRDLQPEYREALAAHKEGGTR